METFSTTQLKNQLGSFVMAKPITSNRSGNAVCNQYNLVYENGRIMQSYNSLIGIYIDGKYYFSKKHDYSKTTSTHCSTWCGYGINERRKGLNNGRFGLLDSCSME